MSDATSTDFDRAVQWANDYRPASAVSRHASWVKYLGGIVLVIIVILILFYVFTPRKSPYIDRQGRTIPMSVVQNGEYRIVTP